MEQDSQSGRKRQVITTLAVLIVIVVIVAAATVANKKKDDTSNTAVTQPTSDQSDTTMSNEASTTETTNSTSNGSASSSTSSSSGFKDGTYTATGKYNSPGGTEKLTVTVTLKDGAVTDSSVKSGAGDPEGAEYQDRFIGSYKQYVTGKKIDSIKLGRVAGSSLTSQGFNDAIDSIESQAKA